MGKIQDPVVGGAVKKAVEVGMWGAVVAGGGGTGKLGMREELG